MIFVDTSAFFALADCADAAHQKSKAILTTLMRKDEDLFTHNYVVVETIALLHRRLGVKSAIRFLDDMTHFPVAWVNADLHAQAAHSFARGKSATISFVDQVSFTLMRQKSARAAFAFDDDFRRAGFTLYP